MITASRVSTALLAALLLPLAYGADPAATSAPPGPPPPPPEAQGSPATATWVAGSWEWNGSAYVWHPGAWRISSNAAPAAPAATAPAWVGGHWAQDPSGAWTWVPGHYDQQSAATAQQPTAPPATVVVQQPAETRTVYVDSPPSTVYVSDYWGGPFYGGGYYGGYYGRPYCAPVRGSFNVHVGLPLPLPLIGFGGGFGGHHGR